MMARRRCPSAAPPSASTQTAPASGPRCLTVSIMASPIERNASAEVAARQSIMPAIPHIALSHAHRRSPCRRSTFLLKSARMNDREPLPPRKSAYALVPAASIRDHALGAFAAALGPGAPSLDQIRASWWTRAQPHCAVAAVHIETGTMVGLCAGRPSEWIIAGQTVPAVAVCDWYVHPNHAGKLIGKRMVQHFQRPGRMLYGISISDVAIAYLQRRCWWRRCPGSATPLSRCLRQGATSTSAIMWWAPERRPVRWHRSATTLIAS